MRGYVEQAHFDESVITGWAFDPETAQTDSLIATCKFDGNIIGQAQFSGTRADLRNRVSKSDNLLFKIHLSQPVNSIDIISQRIVVEIKSATTYQILPLTAALTLQLVRMGTPEYDWPKPPLGFDSVPGTVLPHSANGAQQGNLTPVMIPIGLESHDKSAKIGRDGHLFLTGGTNGVESLYSDNPPELTREKTEEWLELFNRRRNESARRGIQFLQCIIPEKLTVLNEMAPFPVLGPTPLLQGLETALRPSDFYVSGVQAFTNWARPDGQFLKADSHLSPTGAQVMFANLASKLNTSMIDSITSIKMDNPRFEMGDLSRRFYRLPIYGGYKEPDTSQIARHTEKLIQTENSESATKHIGSRFSWRNDSAQDPRKVIVFGNSFFGPGKRPIELSWWGKTFFREFHFVWSPEIDWDIVDRVRPDVIIGQTIERFLPAVPKT
ncbi:alginate O-acetyltransferase AlgX-related protein [Arthrobacter psychrolactophilus]